MATSTFEKKDNIKENKEYNLEIDEEKYKLVIYLENNSINFRIHKINDIELINYENKYTLKSIIIILGFNSNTYKNLEEVL